MLEMFFDEEKVFRIFEQIIKQGSDKICYPRICYELGIKPSVAAEVLNSFLFLDILQETEESKEEGIFLFNKDSIVVLGLCFFDEVVGKYCIKKMSDEFGDIVQNIDGDGEEINIEEITFEQFLHDILGDGL